MTRIKGTEAVQVERARYRACWHAVTVAIVCLTLWLSRDLPAYTPESPEVKVLLSRAMDYLQRCPKTSTAERLGGCCLIGLAAYKYNNLYGNPEQLPSLTQTGISRALEKAQSLAGTDNYSSGIALILLSEVNPHEHVVAMQLYAEEIERRQKPHGGWGYSHFATGDMSQLQYSMLGLWSARNCGVEVPDSVVADCVDYLIRVQDPTGAWGYQGRDPGFYVRVTQNLIRPSLCAAGVGSLYVGADFLGMSKSGKPRTVSRSKLPPALTPVLAREERRSPRADALVKVDLLTQAISDGNEWFRLNPSLETNVYQHYFLYGYERYRSFREKVEGTQEEAPQWYDDGVRLLAALQSAEGSWGVDSTASEVRLEPPIATAFSMLFLLRSTRATIEKVIDRDGILRGGYGLPSDLSEVRLRNNRIVAPAITGEVEDLVTMLEDGEGEKIENMLAHPDALLLSQLQGAGDEFRDRLTRVLRTGSFEARMVAARALGRQNSLDNVPILIYALTDPNLRVVREARDGLRLISRKFDGLSLPDNPTPGEVDAAVQEWKDWYKTIRPDTVFLQ